MNIKYNNIFFKTTLIVILIATTSVNAGTRDFYYNDWQASITEDEFDGTLHAKAFTFGKQVYNDRQSIGIRCFDNGIKITFDMIRYIASGQKRVLGRYRIDQNTAVKFDSILYSNSFSAGYQENFIKDNNLLDNLKSGSEIIIEISNKRRSNIYKERFSLLGFKQAYEKVNEYCK